MPRGFQFPRILESSSSRRADECIACDVLAPLHTVKHAFPQQAMLGLGNLGWRDVRMAQAGTPSIKLPRWSFENEQVFRPS